MPNLSLLINNSTLVKKAVVGAVVKAGTEPDRMPVWRTPAQYGLEFKDVDIEASDGIRLSAWEMVRSDTNKLAVVNHPLMCNRYGSSKGVDNVPVEFIPMLKHLYVAGYSILTYDQRGQGDSDGNIGAKSKGPRECVGGSGAEEWKDLAGVLNYVKSNWKDHDVALLGQCMGANAIFKAFSVSPEIFEGVKLKCFAALQPTRSMLMRGRMTKKMLGIDLSNDAAQLQEENHGFAGVDCVEHAPNVKLPVLIAGMKADVYAGDDEGIDLQNIFDAVAAEKRLHFFGPGTDSPFGSGLRFEGYSYYNYHPEPLIDFLNSHMGGVSSPPAQPVEQPGLRMEKDEDHSNCQQCGKPFGFPRPRRHHCRACGHVLCSSCSPKQVAKDRACLPCWVHDEVEKMNATDGKEVDTEFETSIDIDAPASIVWNLFMEGNAISSWSSSLQSIEGDIKEGAEVTIKFKFMGLDFSVKHVVRKFEDGVQFSWGDEIDHNISNNHLFRIETIDETHCKFINNDKLIGGDPVVRYSVLREMQAVYEQQNEEVKAEAEKRHELSCCRSAPDDSPS